jgi:hypothetical protein
VRGEEREEGVRWCKPSVGTRGAVEFDPEAAISFASDALLTVSDGRRRGARRSEVWWCSGVGGDEDTMTEWRRRCFSSLGCAPTRDWV